MGHNGLRLCEPWTNTYFRKTAVMCWALTTFSIRTVNNSKMKKYDSNDLTVAFAIGMLLGLGIMVLTIIY